ncbi:MAG: SGNH/GDSL hydrolase family protein [Acidimicrobiales bacterium]
MLTTTVAGLVVLSACFGPPPEGPPLTAVNPGPPPLYVAVGASDSAGVGSDVRLRDAWPQVFFRSSLPREMTFVNLAVEGSTVADALQRQMAEAVRLEPGLVTVWLNVNDIIRGVTAAAYEAQLGQLVTRLRRDGATRVLVGNVPPLDLLAAYETLAASRGGPPRSTVDAVIDAYNQATARVARDAGAVLVDLHAAGLAARAAGTEAGLVAADGFHPSNEGHRRIAAIFGEALARSR